MIVESTVGIDKVGGSNAIFETSVFAFVACFVVFLTSLAFMLRQTFPSTRCQRREDAFSSASQPCLVAEASRIPLPRCGWRLSFSYVVAKEQRANNVRFGFEMDDV